MDKKLINQDSKNVEEIQMKNNEYSIYDYFKGNTTALLAAISGMVTIVYSFSELTSLILAQKELAFWEFSSSYATFGNGSSVYTVIILTTCIILLEVSSLLYIDAIETYLRNCKIHFFAKYLLEKLAEKSKKGDAIELEVSSLESDKLKKVSEKLFEIKSRTELFLSIIISIIISSGGGIVYGISDLSNSGIYTWLFVKDILVFFIFLYGLPLIVIIIRVLFIKKYLKEKCNDYTFVVKFFNDYNIEETQFINTLKKGFRSVLSNNNIILSVIFIIIGSFCTFCSSSLSYINFKDRTKTFQITTIDNISYAIVYQDEDQYYLEEIKVDVNQLTGTEILTVYTNQQRIITINDVKIEIKEFDWIFKEHKPCTSQE